ncbi:hypothetical protein ASPFODRAFT_63506 [Aspergillus luchuensis CBS 106.47]|uniref:Uncharacterized protein n=1 Tax=Aspergillus luchuensis (strain CBS 106.47) TaxID=1137211 RepID=A0A1M3T9A7_ASPLC|nr:hypothetical protein ASPFODRAFT_63506 [Aspergillus luchuensis CBS 106.47]
MPKLSLIPHQDIVTDNRQPLQLSCDHACFSSQIAAASFLLVPSWIPRCILFAQRPARDVSARSHHLVALPMPRPPVSDNALRQSDGFLRGHCRLSVAALHHR